MTTLDLPGTSPTVHIDSIRIGERDRTDPGNLDELADSIGAVGLLHPIVITASRDLVAGGRRLAALRKLGWVQIPVSVADLTNVADLLQAEHDENTCRKPLTPMEASRARERRTRLLAPKIQENRGGRPANRATEKTGSNLEPVSPAARKTRAAASIGTGYSASTLDKVDEIRDIAERGVVTVGKGRDRQEVAASESVVEVAREHAAHLEKTSAAIDPAFKAVKGAVREFIESEMGKPGGAGIRLAYRRDEFNKAVGAAASALCALKSFSAEEFEFFLAEDSSRRVSLAALRDEYQEFFAEVLRAHPTQLRLISGGN